MHILHDFKGFSYAQLDLFEPFTVLIGPNGSGKSNAIEGVELLSFIANGKPLYEIYDLDRGKSGIQVRGGLQACPRNNKSTFTLGFDAYYKFEGKLKGFNYEVSVKVSPSPRIAAEKLVMDDGNFVFQTLTSSQSSASDTVQVQYNNFARGGNKPKETVSANQSVLSQYGRFANNINKFKPCVRLVEGYMAYLKSSFVFDPNAKLMRNYERIGNSILARDGSNLSAVLYGLSTGNTEKKNSLRRLVDWIAQVPEEPIKDITFVSTKLHDVIFAFDTNGSNHPLDARVLSDGTLRCLAVLTALETADPNSRVIIEEFDNGLHPSRVKVLTGAIKECCKRRQLNVLVTTHNPATLNALDEEQLGGVVLCRWDANNKTSALVPLKNIPRSDEMLEAGRLGDLVSKRVIEKYLAPKFEKEKRENALKWLEDLDD